MNRTRWVWLTLFLLLGMAPVAALTDDQDERREQNRLKLEKLRRNDPNQLAVYYARAKAFLEMPEKERKRLRRLDEIIHHLWKPQRERLLAVLEKYAAWLDRLSPEQRRQIDTASSIDAKLQLIKSLREQQWTKTLAKVHREELKQLDGEARRKRISQLRQQQWKRKVEWQIASKHWDMLVLNRNKQRFDRFPQDMDSLTPATQWYVNELLKPMLSEAELKQLEESQGQWPWFPYILVRLADQHTLALPNHAKWPQHIADLPAPLKDRLPKNKQKEWNQLIEREGKWQDFVNSLAQLIQRQDPSKKESFPLNFDLWPLNFKHLSPSVRKFLTNDLRPLLSKQEEEQLRDAAGTWPDYPETVQQLARKYFMRVPWQSLPGLARSWDDYRPFNTTAD